MDLAGLRRASTMWPGATLTLDERRTPFDAGCRSTIDSLSITSSDYQ